jgi:hypothetical protein
MGGFTIGAGRILLLVCNRPATAFVTARRYTSESIKD